MDSHSVLSRIPLKINGGLYSSLSQHISDDKDLIISMQVFCCLEVTWKQRLSMIILEVKWKQILKKLYPSPIFGLKLCYHTYLQNILNKAYNKNSIFSGFHDLNNITK